MELIELSPFLIFFALLSLAAIGLWFYALADIVRSRFEGSNEKIVWLLLVFFVPFIGTLLYFIIGRKSRITHTQ